MSSDKIKKHCLKILKCLSGENEKEIKQHV